jgi:membrane-associated protease RseP (regulator of RpoE activity)
LPIDLTGLLSGVPQALYWYLAVWVGIILVLKLLKGERFGFEVNPILLLYRTTRLNRWVEVLSARRPTAWRVLGNIGIVVGVGGMIFIIYQLIGNLYNLVNRPQQAYSIQPIIPVPGLGVSWETFPYIVIALSVVLATHELAHAVASVAEGVRLKSTGVLVVIIGLFGGFAEPDENELEKSSVATQLRVYAAGASSNVILGVFVVLLLGNFSATISPGYDTVNSGVLVGSLIPDYPAQAAGIIPGDVVVSINGTAITKIDDLQNFMRQIQPGGVVEVETTRASFLIKTKPDSEDPNRALLGIGGLSDYITYPPRFAYLDPMIPIYLQRLEFWLTIILISVGLINMLPIYPLDGGRFLETLLKAVGVGHLKEVRYAFSSVFALILISNMVISGALFGFRLF